MSVIINDFEVVVEPPPERLQVEDTEEETKAASLSPQDVHRVICRREERWFRTWAH